MPFEKAAAKVPAKLGRVTVHATTMLGAKGEVMDPDGSFEVQVLAADGHEIEMKHGDLKSDHITDAERAAIHKWLTGFRNRAASEIIP